MSEFEKWYNNEIRPYIHNPKDKPVVKHGWKAALEWVLRIEIDHYENDFLSIDLCKDIRKELEQLNQ